MRQNRRIGRSILPALLLTVFTGWVFPAAVKYENALRKVTTIPSDKQLIISFDAVGDYRYEQFELNNPKRVVIDLIHLNNEIRAGRVPVADDGETVRNISVTQFRQKNPAITRVTMTLGKKASGYNVVRDGGQMRVVFQRHPTTPVPQTRPVTKPVPSGTDSISTSGNSTSPGTRQNPVAAASAEPSMPAEENPSNTVYFRMASMQPNPRQVRLRPLTNRRVEPIGNSSSEPSNRLSEEQPAAAEAVTPAPPPAPEEQPIIVPAAKTVPRQDESEIQPAAKNTVSLLPIPKTANAIKPASNVHARLDNLQFKKTNLPVLPVAQANLATPQISQATMDWNAIQALEAAENKATVSHKLPVAGIPAKSEKLAPVQSTPAQESIKPKLEVATAAAIQPKKTDDLVDIPLRTIIPIDTPAADAPVAPETKAIVMTAPTQAAPAVETASVQRIPVLKSPEAAITSVLNANAGSQGNGPAGSSTTTASAKISRDPSTIFAKSGGSNRNPSNLLQTTGGVGNNKNGSTPSAPSRNVQPASTQYMGEPIDFKVRDMDLVDFFRVMSEISGLNISIDPDVSGKVTMSLMAVPWDQIFDLGLSTHKLVRKIEGNVVRVSKKETLQSEEKAIQSLKEAQLQAMELQTSTVKLNYGNAEQIMPTLEKQLSAKGTIVSDKRTNTLIITDIPPKLDSITHLIRNLDVPEKQVRIEARVVQATRTFSQEIGVNLGFLVGYGERVTAGGPPVRSSYPSYMNENVSLGALNNLGNVGVKVGNILDTFQLDAAISAGESKGLAKLISRPTTSGQNNSEAVIRQGVRFPIQTIQNNTISIQYQDASLTLRVTPQITQQNTILMKIRVENNVADFTRMVNGIPSIKTNESDTIVLVPNGGTTVIGGILIDEDRNTTDAVPGLASIPVFGHLFKKRDLEKQSDEVLFFITPTITE